MRTAKQRKAWSSLSAATRHFLRKQPLSQWARRIKKEFQYKCVECGTENNLEAHHIYFKAKFPSRREDLDNGISLCTACHDYIHSLFIEDEDKYYQAINEYSKKRTLMKSISSKKRNPSANSYKIYKKEKPENETEEEEKEPIKKKKSKKEKPQKTKKNKKKTIEIQTSLEEILETIKKAIEKEATS